MLFLEQIGLLTPTKMPNINPMCVVTMSPAQADQSAGVGTKSGPPDTSGVSERGIFDPKGALFGAQARPDTRSKSVVTIISSQSAAIGTKFGPLWPTEDLRASKRAFQGQNEFFWPQVCHRDLLRGQST